LELHGSKEPFNSLDILRGHESWEEMIAKVEDSKDRWVRRSQAKDDESWKEIVRVLKGVNARTAVLKGENAMLKEQLLCNKTDEKLRGDDMKNKLQHEKKSLKDQLDMQRKQMEEQQKQFENLQQMMELMNKDLKETKAENLALELHLQFEVLENKELEKILREKDDMIQEIGRELTQKERETDNLVENLKLEKNKNKALEQSLVAE